MGNRATLASWLDASVHYAHTDILSSDSHDELAVVDAILHHNVGPFALEGPSRQRVARAGRPTGGHLVTAIQGTDSLLAPLAK